jgi:hypothetical protein
MSAKFPISFFLPHNEDLHNMYSLQSLITMMKSRRKDMGKTCSMNGENGKNACRLLVGKPEGKKPLGRTRCRCMDLGEV